MRKLPLLVPLFFTLTAGPALAEEEATLETRAAEFLEACEAASPEQRNFIDCRCGSDYVLDYPNKVVAANEKKSREFHDRAKSYKKKMVTAHGEEIVGELAQYCPLYIRARNKEKMNETDKELFLSLNSSLKARTGADAVGYCGSMARAEQALLAEDHPLPSLKTFWGGALRNKACLKLEDYAAHLLKDIPPAPAGVKLTEVEVEMNYTRVMRSFNGLQNLDLTFTVSTDLNEQKAKELYLPVFKRGADRAVKTNLYRDWDNKTVLRAIELEIQSGIENTLKKSDNNHHIYGVTLTGITWK